MIDWEYDWKILVWFNERISEAEKKGNEDECLALRIGRASFLKWMNQEIEKALKGEKA